MNRRTFLSSLACLIPARAAFVPYVVGANTAVTGYGLFEAIALIRKLGFPTIEVQNLVGVPEPTPGEFPGFELHRIDAAQKRRLTEALAGFEHITTHLPYTGLEYSAAPGPQATAGIDAVDRAIAATAFLGAKIAVLHPKPGPDMTLEQTWPIMLSRLRRWGEMAARAGFRIALETGFPRSVKDFVRLVEEVNHPHVGACLDVGHQSRYAELVARVAPSEKATKKGIRAYNDINIELVERLGGKLIHLHVHDIEPDTWKEHKPLIHGFVDYPRLLAKLGEIDYRGVLMFEIGGPPEEMPGFLADAKEKLEAYLRAAR
ncbi:MAG: sugar phosphate isomerase/epimerase [bacterium]|nr:sugar phosphate isomerase/epimerase [bacterium]